MKGSMSFKKLQLLPPQELTPPPLKAALTIWNLWHMFVAMKGAMEPSTAIKYASYGRDFCNFTRDRNLDAACMSAWMLHLQRRTWKGKKVANNHINDINSRIKSFLKFLFDMKYINTPLWRLLVWQIPEPPKKAQVITEEEFNRIKAWCAGKERWQAVLWVCILGYRTGMSKKDCCLLRRCHVRLSEDGPCYIDIVRHKLKRMGEKAACTIPVIPGTDIHQWLVNLSKVENYKRHDGINDYVHQDAAALYESRTARRYGIGSDIRYVFDKVGIPKEKSFRHFRNSMCSNLVNSGGQLALIMKITGHSNAKTLLGYLNVDRSALEEVMLKAQQYAAQQIEQTGVEQHSGFLKEQNV